MEDFQGLLNIATDVGFCLLENGAEIYRVEDSICRKWMYSLCPLR